MDVDYLSFAVLMGVLGIVGITATANVAPNILQAPTCNCIPSTVARLQELSIILLAFSAILAPVGILRRSPRYAVIQAQGQVSPASATAGPWMRSGELFFLGVSLVVLGIAVVAIPSFLVLGNRLLTAEGAGMVALGIWLAYRGGRSK